MRPSATPLITTDLIQRRIAEMGDEISAAHGGEPLLLLAVLKGSFLFAADLSRALRMPLQIDFIRARSYAGTESTGAPALSWTGDALAGRHVLLVEDILDTGLTAAAIVAWAQAQGPATLRICTLLDKPTRRRTPITADYTGFVIPDLFVVGYGLDYEEEFRNLPAIHTLEI
jgi:hypoxanthine phosphoribosyltransferase